MSVILRFTLKEMKKNAAKAILGVGNFFFSLAFYEDCGGL